AEQILLLDQFGQHDVKKRDDFLDDVARAVFDHLTAADLAAPSRIVTVLADAVHGGHIRLHSTEPAEQRLFADIGTDGALPPTGADSFELVTQNGSESKA